MQNVAEIPAYDNADPFYARLQTWSQEQAAWLASITDWEHEAADMPSLDAYYVAQQTERCVLGHKVTASAQYVQDEARGGLVALALGYGK